MRSRGFIAGGIGLTGLLALLLLAGSGTAQTEDGADWGRLQKETLSDAPRCGQNGDYCTAGQTQARRGSAARRNGSGNAQRGRNGRGGANAEAGIQVRGDCCAVGSASSDAGCGNGVSATVGGGCGNGNNATVGGGRGNRNNATAGGGCGNGNNATVGGGCCGSGQSSSTEGGCCASGNFGSVIEGAGRSSLTAVERADLFFMLQEEQLARDVYTRLLAWYEFRPYANISRSEQMHMDLLREVADAYDIQEAPTKKPGEFTNPEIQRLHNQLVAQGRQSLDQAIVVGARIEEMDIVDLRERLARTTNPDVERVYTVLETGSRNHLRAFARHLQRRSIEFTPKYLSEKEFWEIANGSHERCNVASR